MTFTKSKYKHSTIQSYRNFSIEVIIIFLSMKSLTTTLQSILPSLLNKYIFCIYFRLVEVFSWLLEVANDTKENWDGGKIIWSVSYVFDAPKLKDSSPETTGSTPEETRKKIIAKLEINKDDIQAVLPIAKVTNREKLLHE